MLNSQSKHIRGSIVYLFHACMCVYERAWTFNTHWLFISLNQWNRTYIYLYVAIDNAKTGHTGRSFSRQCCVNGCHNCQVQLDEAYTLWPVPLWRGGYGVGNEEYSRESQQLYLKYERLWAGRQLAIHMATIDSSWMKGKTALPREVYLTHCRLRIK